MKAKTKAKTNKKPDTKQNKAMKTYKQRKDAARDAAIELQSKLSNDKMSWQEATETCAALYRGGERYGLLTEFRENGLI